jgi:hypothetical protein
MRFTLLLLVGCAVTEPPADHDTTRPTEEGDDTVIVPYVPVVPDPPFEEPGRPAPECTETYTIPGPQGTVIDGELTAHQDVYGGYQDIGTPTKPVLIGPIPQLVHIGWPSSDPSASVSFVWSTDTGTLASLVEWGEGDALDHRTAGISYGYGPGNMFRVHELKLCGRLQPGTRYSYRVGGAGHWSPVYSFSTPPPVGTFQSFVVAYSGDSRGDYETWGQMVDHMEAFDPDFYLFGGDMVSYGVNQYEWYSWFDAAGDVFARKPVIPAHGNHEYLAANYFALFSLPNNEQWFSANYGDLAIVALNDTVTGRPDAVPIDQVAFLRSAMAENPAAWRVAYHHQSTYSSSSAHGSNLYLRNTWGPVLDELGFDFVLAGHDHTYERTVPIRAGAPADPSVGAYYFVAGGAGAPLYRGHDVEWFTARTADTHNYMIGVFTPDGVTWTARDLADNVIDELFVPRRRP